jgi:hypothetical protein
MRDFRMKNSSSAKKDKFSISEKRIQKKNSKSKFVIKKVLKKLLITKINDSENTDLKKITSYHLTTDNVKDEILSDTKNDFKKTQVIDSAIFDEYDKAYVKSFEKIEAIKREMFYNIEKLIERDANLNNLQEKSCNLNMNVLDLQITSKSVRRKTFKKKQIKIISLILAVILIVIFLSFYLKYVIYKKT